MKFLIPTCLYHDLFFIVSFFNSSECFFFERKSTSTVPSDFQCTTISFVGEYFGIDSRKHNSC